MILALALALALEKPVKPAHIDYTIRIDPAALTHYAVEMRIRNAPASITLAAAAHPEYDDKYWRQLEDLTMTDALGNAYTAARRDSVLWQFGNPAGELMVRYRIRLHDEGTPRAAWRPFLTRTGALVGGPHSFLYVLGHELSAPTVTLEIPDSWKVATGLGPSSTARSFRARNVHTLMESPIFVGEMSEWSFRIRDVPHRVFYWRLPNATAFDTTTFLRSIERFAQQTIDLFGQMPYPDYTFIFRDGAYGGLEHPNSVTLGAESRQLATNPNFYLGETAHEFFHTWNLMRIKPIEYRTVDYRTQPPVASLWFSEGLTLFYADALSRRAGLHTWEATRIEHLESLIRRYYSSPGNARFSAEAISRVAYNAGPGALGDYNGSAHLQGELIGTLMDLVIRSHTAGKRTMDDVMRLMNTRFAQRGFTGRDVQQAGEEVCGCSFAELFDNHVRDGRDIDFAKYLALIGLDLSISWQPAVDAQNVAQKDLRLWGYNVAGEGGLRLQINNPESVWGKAGIHTGDKLVSINGAAITTWPELRTVLTRTAIGEALHIIVDRPSGRAAAHVVMSGYSAPVVRIAPSGLSPLRAAWMRGW